jgi:hypothetical protein
VTRKGGKVEQILYWLAGGLGVPLVNGLKQWLGIEGKSAVWLTAAVAALLAAIAVLVTEAANWAELTPEQLFAALARCWPRLRWLTN